MLLCVGVKRQCLSIFSLKATIPFKLPVWKRDKCSYFTGKKKTAGKKKDCLFDVRKAFERTISSMI